MKKLISYICALALLAAVAAHAEKNDKAAKTPEPKKASAEFEKMKTLVGTWTGKVDMGQGPTDIAIKYRLLAGGSVLEERMFEGTDHEMVTMYYDQDGKLAMTHYCMFGNRPSMKVKSADTKTIKFDFDATCGINPNKESHMHAMSISFEDADTITTKCTAIVDGKELPDHASTFKRSKS